ncbi:MAG: hypothetical protein ACK5UP_15010, partial [Bacteroidota bacterium]
MNLTRIITIVLFIGSAFLAWRLYDGVQSTIDQKAEVERAEAAVIERLKLIREAEIVFFEVNKRYTANWDSLANFIETGRVPIINRREEIKQIGYGQEEVKVFYDTIGYIPAKDRIFKKEYTVNASENGIFMGFKVKVGDRILKNQKGYTIKVGEKPQDPPFTEQGIITNLADVKVGDEIKKGQTLINFWDYIFDPNVDIKNIGKKPKTIEDSQDVMFTIYVGKVDKNGVLVQTIEVKDPKPDNPQRKESNEAKNRKPLQFG